MFPASTRAVREARRADVESFASSIAHSRTTNATPISRASRALATIVSRVSPSRRLPDPRLTVMNRNVAAYGRRS